MFRLLVFGLLCGVNGGVSRSPRQYLRQSGTQEPAPSPAGGLGNFISNLPFNPNFGSILPPNSGVYVPNPFQGSNPVRSYDGVVPPTSSSTVIPIIKLEIQPNDGTGSYKYSYETGNGIIAEEEGYQKAVGEPPEYGTSAKGSYSYTDPDGKLVSATYTADENGFVIQGSHIPTPHPIPKEILEALEKNAAEEAQQNKGEVSPALKYYLGNTFKQNYLSRRK